MSYSLFRAGDWKQGLRVARNLYEDEGATSSNAVARIAAGLIHAHRGEVRPARRLLLEADEVARKREAVMLQLLTGWGLGLLSEYSGDRDLAETHYRRLLSLWERGAVINDAIPGLTAAAGFFSSHHAFAEAGTCTDILGSMLDSSASPEVVSALAYVQGETAFFRGDAESASDAFVRSLSHLDKLVVPLERTRANFRAGAAFLEIDEATDGIGYLREGYQGARRLGARPLATQIAGFLSNAGAPTETERLDSAAGLGDQVALPGLTRRQAEVAIFLSRGLTNKEIATQLGVSTRTVDMHVGHVFERLNVRSRTEAAVKLAEESSPSPLR